jgi:hypothetical protein
MHGERPLTPAAPDHDHDPDGRRSFLKKAGIGVAAAWVAPTVLSTAAHAQGSGAMGAPLIRGAATSADVPGGTATVDPGRPAGTADGDLMLAVVTCANNRTVSTPTGWTLLSGPNSTGGGTQIRSYNFAYTGPSAASAVTEFTRSPATQGGAFRAAIITFQPGSGGTGVAIDVTATPLTDAGNTTRPFPAVTFTAANFGLNRTVVYGGAAGGSATWTTPNPGASVGVQSVGNTRAITISYTTDVDTSPGTANGTTSSSVGSTTYTSALVTT